MRAVTTACLLVAVDASNLFAPAPLQYTWHHGGSHAQQASYQQAVVLQPASMVQQAEGFHHGQGAHLAMLAVVMQSGRLRLSEVGS